MFKSSWARVGALAPSLLAIACGNGGSADLADPMDDDFAHESFAHEHDSFAHDAGMLDDSGLPDAAHVAFVSPHDGETVVGPLVDGKVAVRVEIALEDATLRPAGELAPGTGHHHVLVDLPAMPEGTPIPFDERHVHLGQGQPETELWLTPGEHELTLQFADGAHRSYGPALSASVSITVRGD